MHLALGGLATFERKKKNISHNSETVSKEQKLQITDKLTYLNIPRKKTNKNPNPFQDSSPLCNYPFGAKVSGMSL